MDWIHCMNFLTRRRHTTMTHATGPLPLEMARKLLKYKKDNKLDYTKLAKEVGFSASLLSSRITHCQNNIQNKPEIRTSGSTLNSIDNFLKQQMKKNDIVDVELRQLVREIERQGWKVTLTPMSI